MSCDGAEQLLDVKEMSTSFRLKFEIKIAAIYLYRICVGQFLSCLYDLGITGSCVCLCNYLFLVCIMAECCTLFAWSF